MTRTTNRLASATETAAVLSAVLGNCAAWPSWLADQRRPDREHPALLGLHLYPYAASGIRPLYRPADIKDFIAAVRAADSGLSRSKYDDFVCDDTPGLPWRMRRARRCIHRLVAPSIIGAPRPARRIEPGASGPAPT